MTNIPEPLKQAIFSHILKDFSCAADKKLNDALLDAANSLDKAFGEWQIEKIKANTSRVEKS